MSKDGGEAPPKRREGRSGVTVEGTMNGRCEWRQQFNSLPNAGRGRILEGLECRNQELAFCFAFCLLGNGK